MLNHQIKIALDKVENPGLFLEAEVETEENKAESLAAFKNSITSELLANGIISKEDN